MLSYDEVVALLKTGQFTKALQYIASEPNASFVTASVLSLIIGVMCRDEDDTDEASSILLVLQALSSLVGLRGMNTADEVNAGILIF